MSRSRIKVTRKQAQAILLIDSLLKEYGAIPAPGVVGVFHPTAARNLYLHWRKAGVLSAPEALGGRIHVPGKRWREAVRKARKVLQ